MAKKEGGGGDELDMLKATLLNKDLEVITIADKMRRVEERSVSVLGSLEKLRNGATEKITSLTDIINFLTSEGNIKDARILELETTLTIAEKERLDTIIHLNKEMTDLTSAHDFQLNNMKLKLEAAQVKLREMADFAIKKKTIEDENAALKEQLLKEQRDHAEAISDVERVSVQEKERLKKEIQTRVEETKREMSNTLKDQLHCKTKRTILENEQLKKEVGYHIQQTEVLLLQNEKLIHKIGEATRSLQLAKELEDDLAHRNHMYQQTTRILVYKLQEKQKTTPSSRKGSVQEEKNIVQLKYQNSSDQNTKATLQSEAIKFLYACLEDIKMERIVKLPAESFPISVDSTPQSNVDSNISKFSLDQRHALITQLLYQAMSLHSLSDNMTKNIPKYSSHCQNHGSTLGTTMSKIRVDDILAMPFEKILKEEAIT